MARRHRLRNLRDSPARHLREVSAAASGYNFPYRKKEQKIATFLYRAPRFLAHLSCLWIDEALELVAIVLFPRELFLSRRQRNRYVSRYCTGTNRAKTAYLNTQTSVAPFRLFPP